MKPGDRVKYVGSNNVYKNRTGVVVNESINDGHIPSWNVDFDKGRWPKIPPIGKWGCYQNKLEPLNSNQFTFYFTDYLPDTIF
jgi:hypothetical protein